MEIITDSTPMMGSTTLCRKRKCHVFVMGFSAMFFLMP